jgi:hypothetical protein
MTDNFPGRAFKTITDIERKRKKEETEETEETEERNIITERQTYCEIKVSSPSQTFWKAELSTPSQTMINRIFYNEETNVRQSRPSIIFIHHEKRKLQKETNLGEPIRPLISPIFWPKL